MDSNNTVYASQRLGMFTASEIDRLMVSGSRPMDEIELSLAKKEGSKKKTIPTIFGDGAITYVMEKVAEVVNGEKKSSATSAATAWGLEHEAEAVAWFKIVTGKTVKYFGAADFVFTNYNEWSGGSIDCEVDEDAIGECKCPYVSSNHIEYLLVQGTQVERQEWLKNEHYNYYCQCQFNMMATKKDKCYFFTYDPRTIEANHRLSIFEILPDLEFRKDLDNRLNEAKKIVSAALMQLNDIPQLSNTIIISGDKINDNQILIAQKG